MAEMIKPPAKDWEGVASVAPAVIEHLSEVHRNTYGGQARDVADLSARLVSAAGDLGRGIYRWTWPPGPAEAESLSLSAERLVVTAGEALFAMARFREGNTDIRPAPEKWPLTLDASAQPPETHFYWLGRYSPIDAFAYSFFGFLSETGRGLGHLLTGGSESAGEQPLRAAADLTAAALTLPVALELGLHHQHPGRKSVPPPS